ncbi:Ig-like domain-containing protein [Nocardioides campestrisoli]|uniref:Ig-like domain-containing protein n=1 Tax=Nocardioides campestrisoli TaxID=2736757 RepID=UPI00163D7A00|nr:Ig-like domain-containing protein [Nocardioides campestrisoli]
MTRRNPRGVVTGLAAMALAGALLPVFSGVASAAPDPAEVASGDGWSVTQAPGGYLVSVELDEPLPVRSDAPTVEVDGSSVGIATESADGLSLTAFTTDPAVLEAKEVDAGWTSESTPADARGVQTVEVPAAASAAPPLPADPLAEGDYEWTESIYKFGDQAIDLAAIGGVRGELEGKVYLPSTGGERPTVILLHGRHTSCYGTGPSNPDRWPCAVSPSTDPTQEARKSIPSYAGYDGTARILASHGYSVVSISANAINSNDNQLAADQGAQARGQLILDTLEMLDRANKGQQVVYRDAWTERDVDLAQALRDGTASYAVRAEGFVTGAPALDRVTPADFVGRFDLDSIGLMGHSRGGEGVTSAAVLNQGLADPWAIKSILPLAPVDFGRMTVPDVPMQVILPYCDGDVSNQQGQHMLDDSRYAFDDDVLRSGVWVMGANHNFYNTVWTPGLYAYSVSDDWGTAARRVEPTCGTDPSVAETSLRLSPAEQYEQGSAYMSAWFRLTMGGERRFLPMFDGSGQVPASLDGADVRTVATAPASARSTIATFESASPLVRRFGSVSLTPCASLSGRTTAQDLAPCATTLGSAQAPHWTPASNGGNVPATPVTRMEWTAGDEVRVSVPPALRDASRHERLSVKVAASESVEVGTDLVLTVVDGTGATWSEPVSELNPYALTRLPTSTSSAATSTLKKVVLQQVNVDLDTLADAGLSVTDLREVRFTPAEDAPVGGAYLSDLAFETSSVGTPRVRTWPVLDLYAPHHMEGDAPSTVEFAAHLSSPAKTSVTGYVSLLGSTTSRAGIAMEKVTFAPGETCKPVTVPLQGDTAPSSSVSTSVKASVINTSGAVMGKQAIAFTQVAEDDGILAPAADQVAPAPSASFGTPGAACAELATVLAGGEVEAPGVVAPGSESVMAAAGFRRGETVTFTAPGTDAVTAEADASGRAVALLAVPQTASRGELALTATGAATGRVATGATQVLDASTTALSLSPAAPGLREPVTLEAKVDGGDAAGPVEFLDGDTVLGTATTTDGVARLALPGFGAGEHRLSARFLPSATTQGSQSAAVVLTLARNTPTLAVALSAPATEYGAPATVSVTVGGAAGGEVELGVGTDVVTLPVGQGGVASHTLPATLGVGTYTLTAQYLGSADTAGSTVARVSYRVSPRATSTEVSAPGKVRKGKKLTVKVRVAGTVPGEASTGTAEVRVRGGGRTLTKTVPVSATGEAKVVVRAPAKGKKVRIRASYSPTANYAPSKAKVKVVTLR